MVAITDGGEKLLFSSRESFRLSERVCFDIERGRRGDNMAVDVWSVSRVRE